MEKLHHRILEFHPDTLEFVRKERNLDKPGQMDAAIDLLDDWVKKQAHFTKTDLSREYLERTIILDKGSVERAKSLLDNLFTMKTATPYFFEKTDSKHKDYATIHEYFVDAFVPKLTKDHYRIYAGKLLKNCFTTDMFTHYYQFTTLILEHAKAKEYCSGFVAVIDYRDANFLNLVAQINLSELHQFVLILMEGYKIRVKGIHMLTSSKGIEILVQVFKQVFSKKIGDRIRVHSTLESLYECVPKDLLPEEFGGEQKSLVELNKDWVEELSLKENVELLEEMSRARVNEKLRDGESKAKDLLGISGSFRTLSVD